MRILLVGLSTRPKYRSYDRVAGHLARSNFYRISQPAGSADDGNPPSTLIYRDARLLEEFHATRANRAGRGIRERFATARLRGNRAHARMFAFTFSRSHAFVECVCVRARIRAYVCKAPGSARAACFIEPQRLVRGFMGADKAEFIDTILFSRSIRPTRSRNRVTRFGSLPRDKRGTAIQLSSRSDRYVVPADDDRV